MIDQATYSSFSFREAASLSEPLHSNFDFISSVVADSRLYKYKTTSINTVR